MFGVSDAEEEQGTGVRKDLFHQGVISKLFPSNNMGLVRSESGREIPFSFEFVVLLGEVHPSPFTHSPFTAFHPSLLTRLAARNQETAPPYSRTG